MASGSGEFNSLGQILARGGEISVALAIAHGWGENRITSMIDQRYAPIAAQTRDELRNIAQQAANAGQSINNLPGGSDFGSVDMPTNPNRLPNEPGNNRYVIIADVQFEEGGTWFQVRRYEAVSYPTDDLMDEMRQMGRNNAGGSPERFGFQRGEPVPTPIVRILITEKRF